MILRLVLAEIRHRPGRAVFLLGGYSLGVAVMVVLLAVGEAMLDQARNRALVGGGDMVLVPAGISAEMLRSGGIESLFLGIDQARFLQREVLEGPRGRDGYGIRAASPVLEGKRLEFSAGERTVGVLATGEIPSRARAAGALPELLAGRWTDSEADQEWANPAQQQLLAGIDRFHYPAGAAAQDSTWAEWHYFNAILDDDRWIYITFLVGGRVTSENEWGGRILLTIREPDGTHRSLTRDFTAGEVRFDTTSPDLEFGDDSYVRLSGGSYQVAAQVDGASVQMQVVPRPHRLFPPTDLGGTALTSGYVVPALFATASGAICLPGRPSPCHPLRRVQAYHDHNWGVWRDVAWEWGTASDSTLSLLYGAVRGDSTPEQGLFAYLVDDRGPLGIFRPREMRITAWQRVTHAGQPLRVPLTMEFEDSRQGFAVRIDVTAAHVTDMNRPRDRFFVQMRGTATIRTLDGEDAQLPGFFETYVDGSQEAVGSSR